MTTDKPANARSLLGWDGGYDRLCREERNVAALLYHLLLQPSNLRRFLAAVGSKLPIAEDEVAIFFEYAYLRDLWFHRVGKDAEKGRELILALLRPPNADELRRMSVHDFNAYFGAVPRPSERYVQSPSNWSIGRFAQNIVDNNEFLRVCRFKWAFNAKPDIVIHTSHDAALCIEAKVESGEGHYPTKNSEVAEFRRRGLPLQRQTDLQAYILRDLLGLRAELMFLVTKDTARSPTHTTVTWGEAFGCLDLSSAPPFAREWIARLGPGPDGGAAPNAA